MRVDHVTLKLIYRTRLVFDSQLKVKPRRVAQVQACSLELTAMLSCWASSGDLASSSMCKDAAKKLHECMSKPVRYTQHV